MKPENMGPIVGYITVHENCVCEWGNKHTGPSTCLVEIRQNVAESHLETKKLYTFFDKRTLPRKPFAFVRTLPVWFTPMHRAAVNELMLDRHGDPVRDECI